MIDIHDFQISSLSPEFDSGDFSCGITDLDKYLKKYALRNQKNNVGTTWILHIKDQKKVQGYYTICASRVDHSNIPTSYIQSLPHYPIPCILIGKLAIDKRSQRLGLGGYLLIDSLRRAKVISKILGCFAVIVDTYDSSVIPFYTKYGFVPFVDKQTSLFLPVTAIPD